MPRIFSVAKKLFDYKYVGLLGDHSHTEITNDGKTVERWLTEPGDIVKMTEDQFTAFKDRFVKADASDKEVEDATLAAKNRTLTPGTAKLNPGDPVKVVPAKDGTDTPLATPADPSKTAQPVTGANTKSGDPKVAANPSDAKVSSTL